MIIDIHYHHLVSKVTEQSVMGIARHAIRAARVMGKRISPEEIARRGVETWGDPTGEKLIESMEDSGVDLTVICLTDDSSGRDLSPEEMQENNRSAGAIASKYPGRVIALAGVDPRRPQAPDMMKQCFEEFGVRGLKYHPDHGYDPGGPESHKLLEVVVHNRGILLSHTGPLMPPARCNFADPTLLADLPVDFPELKIVAAHMGSINWRPWASLASFQPNLYGDLAMWDAYAFGHYELFCRELRAIIDFAGVSKVLFGTDNPIFSVLEPTKNWIRILRDLPTNAPNGLVFTQEETAAILGGNAADLLELDV